MPTSKTVTIRLRLERNFENRKKGNIFCKIFVFFFLVIAGETEYHRMCDTDPGRQCIVNEEWNSVRCYCNSDNCNADEECNCDNLSTLSTSTQVSETTSITDGASELTFSLSVFVTSMMIRNL